jgi:ABC-type amino acid transport/signal transduction systems, periplasmic component/domain
MMFRLLLSATALAVTLTTAQAQTLPERIKTAGKIVVAQTPNYPPLEYKNPETNELTGFDIDLGNALGKELGVKIEWQEVSFEQMASALATNRVDIIMSGMSDTPERQEMMDFVDYLTSGAQFFIQIKRAGEFKELTDFCGKAVGASRRTSFPAEVAVWSEENCVKAGKPAITFTGTEGSADARTQLRQSRLDAAVQGSETLPYIMSLEPDTYKVIGEPITAQYQGIAFTKRDSQLRDAFAAALKKLIENGTYTKIIEKYGLQSSAVQAVAVNGKPLE